MNLDLPHALLSEVGELIRRAVRETTGREVDITSETHLIRDGYLDSISIVNLIFLLHAQYGVEIDVTEIDETNFSSAVGVAALIASHRVPANLSNSEGR